MIDCPNIQQQTIRQHYDLGTLFYRLMWGPHIHHGYWLADEKPRRAQVQLTEKLAQTAMIERGSSVVDVGCGMGGSSCWLANQLECNVNGITISPVQSRWATAVAKLRRVRPRPSFICHDAETIDFPAASQDVVWSVECTEHLYGKAEFFARAAEWLRPGGKFAICAWLAGKDETATSTVEQVRDVCEGMFCPSLGTQRDYEQWMEQAGMSVQASELWTQHVLRTWEICQARVERSGIRWVARLCGKNHTLFLNRFDAILNAYRSGAMEYGCLVAEKKLN